MGAGLKQPPRFFIIFPVLKSSTRGCEAASLGDIVLFSIALFFFALSVSFVRFFYVVVQKYPELGCGGQLAWD